MHILYVTWGLRLKPVIKLPALQIGPGIRSSCPSVFSNRNGHLDWPNLLTNETNGHSKRTKTLYTSVFTLLSFYKHISSSTSRTRNSWRRDWFLTWSLSCHPDVVDLEKHKLAIFTGIRLSLVSRFRETPEEPEAVFNELVKTCSVSEKE